MSCHYPVSSAARERGFSLIGAIFVLVVLALIGAFMITIGTVQQTTVSQAVQASRASHAARSGIEWGIAQALNAATRAATCGAPPPPNPTTAPAATTLTLSGPGLDGFTVAVTCNYSRHQETSECFNVYRITARAQSGAFGEPHYVSRDIETRVTDYGLGPSPPPCF